ncbi:PepSY domain-containing protein [Methylotuvimicrobium sp. KM1]|uniref:PepSY domain-containing protein n=1 Tax=Methylotuvimicrobium sp. KM1 TaxID=3377707 RepID=UPI00384FBF20
MTNLIKVVLMAALLPVSVSFGGELMVAMVSLDEATKQVRQDSRVKVLGAKTESIEDRKVHVIKILTPDGRIQYQRIDAETGRLLGRDR